MNIKNILTDTVKEFCKTNGRIWVGKYDEQKIGITLDGYCLYLIPAESFPFDIKSLLRGGQENNIRRVFPQDGTDAILGEIKGGAIQSLSDRELTVYINPKLLKNFDKTATFKITTPKTGVLVYEEGILSGLIMPMNIK